MYQPATYYFITFCIKIMFGEMFYQYFNFEGNYEH